MYIIYKLIVLSVVFGLVLSIPTSTIASQSFDDDNFESVHNIAEVAEDTEANKGRTVEVVVPALELIPAVISLLPNIVGLKAKLLAIAVAIIKFLAPKSLFLAIGAVATFAFCKLTNLCSLAYDPVVYNFVPPQVRSLVTPERLEDAQQLLMSALQLYAQEMNGKNN